ncbi:MAG: polysaccharide deacetylase family protein [Gemmatimonadota bacterium]
MSPGVHSAVDILMYHSIAAGRGPTCTSPETFREQLRILAGEGYRAIPLRDLARALRGEAVELPERPVVLTFDDGFADFADVAAPELAARGWTATVFLPAGKLGGVDDWESRAGRRPRRLLTWERASELGRAGIDLGAHGVSHADLTRLAPEAARAEVSGARRLSEERTGCPVTSFAAPYGRSDAGVKAEAARGYEAAVGTILGRAAPGSDLYDLPRIEMAYFRAPRRWREYLAHGSSGYFMLRRELRRLRGLAAGAGARRRGPVSAVAAGFSRSPDGGSQGPWPRS